MLRTLGLLLLVMSTSSALESSFASRLNYGVFFKNTAKIVVEQNHWIHTFSLKLPDLQFNKVRKIWCVTEETSYSECHIRNILINFFNDLATSLKTAVEDTKRRAIRLLHTNQSPPKLAQRTYDPASFPTRSRSKRHIELYPSQPPSHNKTAQFKSRSKRGLFDFVGSIANSLFGVATDSEIRALKGHMKKIAKAVKYQQGRTDMLESTMHSFINKSTRAFKSLHEGVELNHKLMEIMSNISMNRAVHLARSRTDITRMLVFTMAKLDKAASFHNRLDHFIQGIHALSQRRLSPLLIPEEVLQKALDTVDSHLKNKFPTFHIVSRHSAYYYNNQKVMYTQHKHDFLVSLNIPVSAVDNNYDLFSITSRPVPFNSSTTLATHITNLPDFIALSSDRTQFIEISAQELIMCTGHSLKACRLPQGHRSVQSPTCALALLLELDTKEYCQFKVTENALLPSVLEVDDGLALVSNIHELIVTCPNTVIRRKGCPFCLFRIPCQCSLLASPFLIPARLAMCKDVKDTEDNYVYPINIPVLQRFYSSEEIKHLVSTSVSDDPIPYDKVPQFSIVNHKYTKNSHKMQTYSEDLDTLAKSVKSTNKLTRPLLALEDDFLEPDSSTKTSVILSSIAFFLTCAYAIVLFLIYRRINMLTALVALLVDPAHAFGERQIYIATMQPKTSTLPPTTLPPCSIVPSNSLSTSELTLLSFEVISVICMTLVLTKSAGLLIGTTIYRTKVCLEVSNGKTIIDIPLYTLTSCPDTYHLFLSKWINYIHISNGCIRKELQIVWENFFIVNKLTYEVIHLPKAIRLSFIQAFRLKSMLLKGEYTIGLKMVHGGRSAYFQKGPVFGLKFTSLRQQRTHSPISRTNVKHSSHESLSDID